MVMRTGFRQRNGGFEPSGVCVKLGSPTDLESGWESWITDAERGLLGAMTMITHSSRA